MDSETSARYWAAAMAADAAIAAGRRVERCRQRMDELRSRGRCSEPDRDRADLADAVARAERARRRLSQALIRWYLGGATPPVEDEADVRHSATQLPTEALHLAYIGAGGSLDRFEIDAYIHGLTELPEFDRAVLAHAVWELRAF